MHKTLLRILLLFLLAAFAAFPLQGQTKTAQDEQTLWKLERSYWNYVQDNDLTSYSGLWHKAFLGWPSVSPAPVHKDHITDWITTQTGKGLTFKSVDFKPAAIQVTGDVAEAYYWVTYKWVNKEGDGAARTIRVTHTWLREGKDWHIIGGMSMQEGANPQK